MSSPNSGYVVAILLDTGNLVLTNRPDDDALDLLWQSFDHPTETMLPGGKIKLDTKTKKPRYLTSWKNRKDPAMGHFSLELNPKGKPTYLLWNKSEKYWTSDLWNQQIISMDWSLGGIIIYNFSFVLNKKESYFTYSSYNASIISRFVMDISGEIQLLLWFEGKWTLFWWDRRTQVEVYAFCGTFGSYNEYGSGYKYRNGLQCEGSSPSNRNKDTFLAIPYMRLPKHAQFVGQGNASECESTCWKYCSCTAYAYDANGCSIWFGDLMNLQQLSFEDNNRETLYLKLAAPEFHDASKNSNRERVIIGIVGAVVGIG
ncbi:G-type lectin S-receptor-like serine/threonine-protein kinase, partial [Trifolium medium]|nr:G-type lectin S-receptor-like serine/threonine-protein kinase [Trifolium medium]